MAFILQSQRPAKNPKASDYPQAHVEKSLAALREALDKFSEHLGPIQANLALR